MEPKQKQHPVVDVTGDGSKVHFCKEQYCIGTWNVRSMNQGKLEVVKQEMARVNVDILGISEVKWTGMGKFNPDDYYIYNCGQESLRRNGVAIIVNKRVWNAVFGGNLKNNRMSSVCFQGKPLSITVIQVYVPISNAEEAETPVLWPPHAKNWLIGKHPDAGRDWGQEEKGTSEGEMADGITDSMEMSLGKL